MLRQKHKKIMLDLLALPTAPFVEHSVREYVLSFVRKLANTTTREDKAGNILIRYKHPQARRPRPICLSAHMDHPGFVADRMIDKSTIRAYWHGGVPPQFFDNARVRFHVAGQWVYGKIVSTEVKQEGFLKAQLRVESADIRITKPKNTIIPNGSPGMWDLPEPRIRGDHIHARACDDLIGCTGLLACLETLSRTHAHTEAYFLFTRAEEVGFAGAMTACKLKTVPKKCLMLAIETSSVIPGVEMGAGPILRVGDKASIYSPGLTAWCGRIAEMLTEKKKGFAFQRKLMDGGSCEATAYGMEGYQTTGICVALGNYHNCDKVRGKLAPEYVSLSDLANMIDWFVALAQDTADLKPLDKGVIKRLGQIEKKYRKRLMK